MARHRFRPGMGQRYIGATSRPAGVLQATYGREGGRLRKLSSRADQNATSRGAAILSRRRRRDSVAMVLGVALRLDRVRWGIFSVRSHGEFVVTGGGVRSACFKDGTVAHLP